MKLPGRSGALSASGLWQSGGSSTALPANPVYDSRTGNQPQEYKATETITFVEGFESGVNDAFEAYITTDNGSGSGGNGGSGAGLYADGGYRYGFNGKENDDEVKGEGNQQDYGFRIYDPRIGRFKSVDPLQAEYPELTPYQFASNTPVWAIDIDGLEGGIASPLGNQNIVSVESAGRIANAAKEWWNSPADAKQKQAIAYQINYRSSGVDLSGSDFNGMTKGEYWFTQLGLSALNYAESNPGNLKIPNTRQPQTPHVEVEAPNGKPKQTVSTNETTVAPTKKLQVGAYGQMKKANAGTGLSADHIPSFAAMKQMREQALGRPLTTAEARSLKNSTLTLSINTKLHQSTSQTYAGRNNLGRIAADAADPIKAITNNVNAYRPALLQEGYTNTEIDHAIKTLSAPFHKPPPAKK